MVSGQTLNFMKEWWLTAPGVRHCSCESFFQDLLDYMFPCPESCLPEPKNDFQRQIARGEFFSEPHLFINYFVKPGSYSRGGVMVAYYKLKAADRDGIEFFDHTQHYVTQSEFRCLLTEQLTDAGMFLLMNMLEQPWLPPGAIVRLPLPFWKAIFDPLEIFKCKRIPGVFKTTELANREEKLYIGMTAAGIPCPLISEWFSDNSQDSAHQARMDYEARRYNFSWNKVDPGKLVVTPKLLTTDSAAIQPIFLLDRRVRFRQFEGERFCYLNSFCSALTEFGLGAEARSIHASGFSMPTTQRTNDFVHRVVEKEFRGSYQFRRLRNKNNKRFDPLRSRCKYPTVVKLKQKGSASYPHCVSIYKNMIFDSSFKHPLKKNRNNFDYLCGGKDQYLGVYWSKQLQPLTEDSTTLR